MPHKKNLKKGDNCLDIFRFTSVEKHVECKNIGIINAYNINFNYNAMTPSKPDWCKL